MFLVWNRVCMEYPVLAVKRQKYVTILWFAVRNNKTIGKMLEVLKRVRLVSSAVIYSDRLRILEILRTLDRKRSFLMIFVC